MKQLFRLFISLSFLLLNGYSSLYAHAGQTKILTAPISSLLQQLEHASFATASNAEPSCIKYAPPAKEELHAKYFVEENEDEIQESTFLKKHTDSSDYFTSYYRAGSRYHCYHQKTRLACSADLSYNESIRYLLFQVILI